MAIVAFDEVAIREPALLIPRKAPSSRCRVREQFADAKLIYCPQVGGRRNLAPALGTRISQNLFMPITGTINTIATPYGLADVGAASGSYILSGIGPPDYDASYKTILIVVYRRTGDAYGRTVSTHLNASVSSRYAGRYDVVTTMFGYNFNYGDSTGTGTTDRRTLASPDGTVLLEQATAICGHFTSATTGVMYINGVEQPLTASGTGGTMSGSGNIQIHDYHNYPAISWVPILLLALFQQQLPESVVASLSDDPFQIFEPM